MTIMSLKSEENHSYHQLQHKMLVSALPVLVERDINGQPVSYSDKFGEEGHIHYNLFRGHARGDGHADRILDHYLGCVKNGVPLKCAFSDEYANFLRTERNTGTTAPVLSLRARLQRVV